MNQKYFIYYQLEIGAFRMIDNEKDKLVKMNRLPD